MTPELLTLQDWARRKYGDAAPALRTLWAWAREGRIHPAPKKHGRTYFVQPDAEYQTPAEVRYGPASPQSPEKALARPPVRA